MKKLVVFYSRTQTTKKVGEELAKQLNCDYEELFDTKNRMGVMGYLKAGKDAGTKKLTILKDTQIDPSKYDLIIIGTPIWNWNMSTPIRTYIHHNKDKFNKVAFFCTMGGSSGKTFRSMEELCGKKPEATLELRTKEVKKGEHKEKIRGFVKSITKK